MQRACADVQELQFCLIMLERNGFLHEIVENESEAEYCLYMMRVRRVCTSSCCSIFRYFFFLFFQLLLLLLSLAFGEHTLFFCGSADCLDCENPNFGVLIRQGQVFDASGTLNGTAFTKLAFGWNGPIVQMDAWMDTQPVGSLVCEFDQCCASDLQLGDTLFSALLFWGNFSNV